MADRVFEYQLMVINNRAEISGDDLNVKIGIRKKTVSIQSLTGLFVQKNETAGIESVLLGYEPQPGQKKVLRIEANDGEKGLRDLVSELVTRRPGIDLRHLSSKEAHAQIGAANTEKIAFIIAPVLILVVIAGIMSPMLIHGLDSGHKTVRVEQFASGESLGTRNLTVRARGLFRTRVQKTTTRKGTRTVRVFVPLVPHDYERGQKIHLIMKTSSMSTFKLRRLARQSSFKGIHRNVLWEGVPGDVKKYFKKKMGLNLADDVQLIEYGARPGKDLWIALGVLMLTLVIMAVVAGVLWYVRFRNRE